MGARALYAAVGVAGIASVLGSAQAADLIVLGGQGAAPGITELAAAFSRVSGHKVTVLQENRAGTEQRINNGPADLITFNPPGDIDDLIKRGKVVADSVTPYMLAGLGVSVRAGAPKPDISTVEAYKAALLAAKSIGYSMGCSGQHVLDGIKELGLVDQLKDKTVRTGSGAGGGPVTFHLARGDFELGVQQTNIMVGQPGTDYVGPVPASINMPCPNSVALLAVSKQQDAARAMIRFMISPEAAPFLRKAHEEPAKS